MRKLETFDRINENRTIIICGCGESLNDLTNPERFITIGVNDVGRKFQPDYLVVVNPKNQFSGDRFKFVEDSKAEYIFTQLDLKIKNPNVVKFNLGTFNGTDFSGSNVLHYTNNSPYIALHLAILMGAKRIGLIGVDFTDNHFFGRTGKHPLAPQFETIDEQYKKMANAAEVNGIEIFNLSKISRLTAFPKMSVGEFESVNKSRTLQRSENLKIVSYSTTPVAGVPAILARCISAKTAHSARCVWATNDYGNGVKFAGDVEWKKEPEKAKDLLTDSDLVIVHNGKVAPEHEKILKGKAVVTMAHNYLWNVDERFIKKGFPGVVVGQYQAVLDEFKNWAVVPNPVPFWEDEYKPNDKPDKITICYTPSGKHEKYPVGHKLYWHSKGYQTTLRILKKLAENFPVNLEIIGNRQISHAESLAMKRRSHIVIDECVTGSYHRNSLEGLSCGAVVVNGLGILPKVSEVLKFCANENAANPFTAATLENLENVLSDLINSGAEPLIENGLKNRKWIEENWNFSTQWEKFWIPAIEKSFANIERKSVFANSENYSANEILPQKNQDKIRTNEIKKGVSIVIPHGGQDRLPHLQACLENLKGCENVGEIIVAEMDFAPRADDVSRRLADKYIFIKRTDLFEKARVLNAASAFAECEFILWLDNDLLVSKDFVGKAAAETQAKNLDFLIAYSEIKYLAHEDTEKFFSGKIAPENCRPIRIYSNMMTDGGAVVIRTDFIKKHGGIPEVFHGWGGEDNAWHHKVRLFGKTGRASAKNIAYHLYHDLSGGNGGDAHRLANPNYENNFEMLKKIRRISNPKTFLENFPPDKIKVCDGKANICFAAGHNSKYFPAIEIYRQELSERFGIRTETVSRRELKEKFENSEKIDAVIAFDFQETSENFPRELLEKTIVVTGEEDSSDESLTKAFAVLSSNENICEKFEDKTNLKKTIWKYKENPAIVLAQVLSLLVNDRKDENISTLNLRENDSNKIAFQISKINKRKTENMTIAKKDDLFLTEFAAFNSGQNYPVMRRWELPFALYQMRLSGFMSVLDCTINPVNFKDRIAGLYPNVIYRHFQPVQGNGFSVPKEMPDEAFDRVVCINTLEHLLEPQREKLLAEMARKLKPGGFLIITCDQYPESFRTKDEILKTGLVRADGEEVFNGFNRVGENDLISSLKKYGLNPVNETSEFIEEAEKYRNDEPYPHTCLGMVFGKSENPVLPKGKKIMLSLLSWNTKDFVLDSLAAYVEEAEMLKRLGGEPFIVVCDNGSIDGTREELEKLDGKIEIPHEFILNDFNKGSSVARNQIIDLLLERDDDYLLMLDGDIEIVPHSSFAMLRHMEEQGHSLGCCGADSYGYSADRAKTTKLQFDLEKCRKDNVNYVALTQYGIFRRAVFEDGIRFDVSEPFNCEGWGFEDNDLAFQMIEKDYRIQLFVGMTYLHREIHSSIRVMKSNGSNPNLIYENRRNYVINKWNNKAVVPANIIRSLQISSCPRV